jgi:hypothetical protein
VKAIAQAWEGLGNEISFSRFHSRPACTKIHSFLTFAAVYARKAVLFCPRDGGEECSRPVEITEAQNRLFSCEENIGV